MARVFIGTSGWIYSHWEGIFYPENLPAENKLRYYSRHFKTVEINYSFYRLPKSSIYQKWYSETPDDFVFAVKASRFITHIKRLKEVNPHTKRGQGAKFDEVSPRYGVGVKDAWKKFLENALNLKEKLGPILFQFPPSFQATEENIGRLENFLKFICLKWDFKYLRLAFEFRHRSWCDEKIYNLLKKYKVAWVIADSPFYPKSEIVTADFVYIRLHGSKILFASKYTKKELSSLAQKIKKWLKLDLDVYCYFNNDAQGYAVENAKELLKFCRW